MAAAEKIERGYLGSLLRLTLLAPTLVEELMEGRAELGATLPELLQPFPEIWELKLPQFGGRFVGSGQSFMSIFLASNSMGER